MVQRRSGASFELEAIEAIGVGRQRGGKYLDGDLAVQPRVACPVHLTHSAGADRAHDFIGTEASSRGEWHPAMLILSKGSRCGKRQMWLRKFPLIHRRGRENMPLCTSAIRIGSSPGPRFSGAHSGTSSWRWRF